MHDINLLIALAMLATLGGGFIAMARFGASQVLVMSLVASTFLVLVADKAPSILREGFAEFSTVALIFSAIALPAHQLQRSALFELVGAHVGRAIGYVSLRSPKMQVGALVTLMLVLTWIGAGLFHNITAIVVAVPIIVTLCASYRLPSRWLLCGALVASNLGGFSTAWGDTPNIIESRVWGLTHAAFFTEILPINFIILLGLSAAVTLLTVRAHRKASVGQGAARTAWTKAGFGQLIDSIRLDRRLLLVGGGSLAGFLLCQFIWPKYEIAAAAGAIVLSVMGDRRNMRRGTLQSLDLDFFMALWSIFLIAHAINHSVIGHFLHELILASKGELWAIALSSYVGTAMTEAASWASAAAPAVYKVNPSHAAAWALGGGICAGSSSLITAASAGIILWTESRRFKGHAVTFGTYVGFGLAVSLVMLAFYIGSLTALQSAGVLQ